MHAPARPSRLLLSLLLLGLAAVSLAACDRKPSDPARPSITQAVPGTAPPSLPASAPLR